MNRGASPYGLRGSALALPNGTLDNPAVRFGRERSGLYRVGDGVVGLAVKKFKALEVTGPSTTVFSNAPGSGHVNPLALVRFNAASAIDAETRLDVHDTPGAVVGRQAVYRQAAGVYGWKWYGYSGGGLNPVPAMTLTGAQRLGIGLTTPGARLHVIAEGGPSMIASAPDLASTVTPYMQISNHHVSASANRHLQWGLAGSAGAFVGGTVIGDGVLMSVGGRLVLAAQGVAKLILEPTAGGSGIQFMQGTTELARLTIAGLWGLGLPAPSYRLHVASSFAGDGVVVSAPVGQPTFSPGYQLMDTPSGATRIAMMGLALVASHFGQTLVGDCLIMTAGTNAGRLLLGAGGAARLTIQADGNAFYRLPPAGTFAVQDSTGTPVFSVSPSGLAGGGIAPGSIGTAQLADGAITTPKLNGPVVTTNNLVVNAVHGALRSAAGPSADFDHVADSAWHPIPQIQTASFNPTSSHSYLCWGRISVAHSAGGRVVLRIVNVATGAPFTVTEVGRSGYDAAGVNGGTTWPATSFFQASMLPVVAGGDWLTSFFRLEVLSPDAGTVRVFAGLGVISAWDIAR